MAYENQLVDEDEYKAEINTMLIALGCRKEEAIKIISDHEIQIQAWTNGKKITTVTAAMAARIFLNNKGMTPLHETLTIL